MGRNKKKIDPVHSEFMRLTNEYSRLQKEYIAEPNFLQKQAILIKINRVNAELRTIESSTGHSTAGGGNYMGKLMDDSKI